MDLKIVKDHMLGETYMNDLKVGDIVQIMKDGYFRVMDDKLNLMKMPTGKEKDIY